MNGLPGRILLGSQASKAQFLQWVSQYPIVHLATHAFVNRAHALGLHVHAWTINSPALMRTLLDIGVDGIMTDETVALRDVLISRGEWHPRVAG